MDMPLLLGRMADVVRLVPGIMDAHYPAPPTIEDGPRAVIYWGGPEMTHVSYGSGTEQRWLPSATCQLLIPEMGHTPQEFATIEGLITPIVDAFVPETEGWDYMRAASYVDRCEVRTIQSRLQVNYAGHLHYAAELYFSIKFHRSAGS
jgi:hypothetical protein